MKAVYCVLLLGFLGKQAFSQYPYECTLQNFTGPCHDYVSRYYHNTSTGRCEPFIFGGCFSNGNNFRTIEGCQSQCAYGSVRQCPNSWIQFEGCCYSISNDHLTFYEAASFCQSLGGGLMQIYNQGKQDFIANELKNVNADYLWIGGSSNNREIKWEWIPSFLPFVYTNWNTGEPNHINTEKCVFITARGGNTWFNQACTTPHRFICEMCPTPTFAG